MEFVELIILMSLIDSGWDIGNYIVLQLFTYILT